jgi:hypothetical protein
VGTQRLDHYQRNRSKMHGIYRVLITEVQLSINWFENYTSRRNTHFHSKALIQLLSTKYVSFAAAVMNG